MADQANTRTSTPPWGITPAGSSFLRDLPIVLAGLAVFYGIVSFAHYGIGPMNTEAEISLAPGALPKYALYSVIRIAAAYALSLVFTLVYGYIAAYNKRAERLMIPLLDTLQSIPVLSFLPGVMVAMVSLFPTRQLGVELGSILLIFTGQVWNMTFSFYSSLKNIPREMREAARVYHFSWFQRFVQMELPYASIGLIWNSMMSVAGGWFFLMACEMFVLGDRDLRLPGLGSYLQTAANDGNTRAILSGVGMMILVIVLMDQLIWRPVIAWAQKFKVEQVEAAETPTSPILELLRRSHLLSLASEWTTAPAREALMRRFAKAHTAEQETKKRSGVELVSGRNHCNRRIALWCRADVRHDRRSPVAGVAQHPAGRRRNVSPRRTGLVAGRTVDRACRHLYRTATTLVGHCATHRADRGFGSRDCALPDRAAGFDSPRWRAGDRRHRFASAGNAVVHPLQRDRRSFGYSYRSERSLLGVPAQQG